jgi:AcrR family transcriptional regulator
VAQQAASEAIEPTASKRSRFHARKQEILDAAGPMFNRHGLRDATLSVVASEIGLNLKSLRYYFQRKEDLVSAAFLRTIDLHRALVDEALNGGSFETRLRLFLRSYFALLAQVGRGEAPEFVHFGDVRALTGPYLTTVGSAYVELFRLTRQLFEDGAGAGGTDQHSADAHLLLSQLHWSVVWIWNYLPQDFARVADRMADVLLNGLSARPGDVRRPGATMPTPFASTDKLSQESFLRAATDLINAMGYRGASVDRISATLNVTKGAFYHHNETRDQLVVACFERTFGIVREAQDAALEEERDGLSRVAAAAISLVSRQMRPEGALLRTSALTAVGPELRQEMQRRLALSTFRFADMLNDGLIDGSVRLCDMRVASEMVTATINSAQELQQWVPGATAENAAELYVRPLLHGFAAAGA